MELRNLITFVRIAEVKNFSKSAQLLGYSQSAVTMQIKQLEQELGRQLFERIGKQVKLTQAGEQLLPYALEILNTAQKAQSMVRENEQITGHLRIGTCESYVIGVLPQVLAAFQQQCPNVEVHVQTGLTTDLFHRLRQNDIDLLFFLDRKLYFPEWIKVFERPEHSFFVASAKSKLADKTHISTERLLQEPLFLTEKGISYRYAMEQKMAEQGFALHPFLEIGNTDVITQFVLQNKGISFLPNYVVAPYIQNGTLVKLDTECPEITMWSQLVYHRNKYITPQMEKMIAIMTQTGS